MTTRLATSKKEFAADFERYCAQQGTDTFWPVLGVNFDNHAVVLYYTDGQCDNERGGLDPVNIADDGTVSWTVGHGDAFVDRSTWNRLVRADDEDPVDIRANQ